MDTMIPVDRASEVPQWRYLSELGKIMEAAVAGDSAKAMRYANLMATKLERDGDPGAAYLRRKLAELTGQRETEFVVPQAAVSSNLSVGREALERWRAVMETAKRYATAERDERQALWKDHEGLQHKWRAEQEEVAEADAALAEVAAALAAGPASAEPVSDATALLGRWQVDQWGTGEVVIQAHTFGADTALVLTGNYAGPEDKLAEARRLCAHLNSASAAQELPVWLHAEGGRYVEVARALVKFDPSLSGWRPTVFYRNAQDGAWFGRHERNFESRFTHDGFEVPAYAAAAPQGPVPCISQERLDHLVAQRLAPDGEANATDVRALIDEVLSEAGVRVSRLASQGEVLRLSPEAQLAFAQALLDPPPPNDALCKAFASHQRLIGNRGAPPVPDGPMGTDAPTT